jgi:predicted ribosomally synthesized peptide with SipW-like signal peptide
MKKKMYVIAAILVVLAILGTGTLAYFTTKVVTHNVITSGGVGITLIEEFPNADKDHKLDGAMPGGEYRKAAKVRNDEEEAWIRVRVTVTADKGKNPQDMANIV